MQFSQNIESMLFHQRSPKGFAIRFLIVKTGGDKDDRFMIDGAVIMKKAPEPRKKTVHPGRHHSMLPGTADKESLGISDISQIGMKIIFLAAHCGCGAEMGASTAGAETQFTEFYENRFLPAFGNQGSYDAICITVLDGTTADADDGNVISSFA